jgi:hypothetical protein
LHFRANTEHFDIVDVDICQQQWKVNLLFHYHGNSGYMNTTQCNVCILAFLYCMKFEVLTAVTVNKIVACKNFFGTNICVWQFADNVVLQHMLFIV